MPVTLLAVSVTPSVTGVTFTVIVWLIVELAFTSPVESVALSTIVALISISKSPLAFSGGLIPTPAKSASNVLPSPLYK